MSFFVVKQQILFTDTHTIMKKISGCWQWFGQTYEQWSSEAPSGLPH
jgi:hypothetical protein